MSDDKFYGKSSKRPHANRRCAEKVRRFDQTRYCSSIHFGRVVQLDGHSHLVPRRIGQREWQKTWQFCQKNLCIFLPRLPTCHLAQRGLMPSCGIEENTRKAETHEDLWAPWPRTRPTAVDIESCWKLLVGLVVSLKKRPKGSAGWALFHTTWVPLRCPSETLVSNSSLAEMYTVYIGSFYCITSQGQVHMIGIATLRTRGCKLSLCVRTRQWILRPCRCSVGPGYLLPSLWWCDSGRIWQSLSDKMPPDKSSELVYNPKKI